MWQGAANSCQACERAKLSKLSSRFTPSILQLSHDFTSASEGCQFAFELCTTFLLLLRQSDKMAPINHKAKTVHRKRPARQEPVRQPSFEDEESEDDADDDAEEQQSAIEPPRSILDLQDMADRVGEEVDRFAETLDKFNDQLRGPNSYDAAHDLCIAYRDHGKDIVKRLKKQHQMQRLQEMKNSFAQRAKTSFFSKSTTAEGDTVADAEGLKTLQQWQAETDTWELFRIMLESRYNPNKDDLDAERQSKLKQLGPHHKYSKTDDLYQRFILESDSTKEKHMIVKWLEDAADSTEGDVNSMAQELEKKSGRGSGLWMNGWMETREKVKGAKRMRLDDGSAMSVRGDNGDALVSELDPDAPARQNKALEKGDNYSERSLWMTCWEMLRRGKSWAEVCDWCLERNQSWRAVSLGLATDKQLESGSSGPAAGALWRRMCFIASKSASASEYEAAVYGLLSGNLQAVQKVCKSWDDVLFANYNCALVAEYDAFLLRHHSLKLPTDVSRKYGLSKDFGQPSALSSISDVQKLIESLAGSSSTLAESRTPIKLIQASLIADGFDELCRKIGTAISDAAPNESNSTILKPNRKGVPAGESQQLAEAAIRDDHGALRIVTHMLIMLRGFHAPLSQPTDGDAIDNVIAAYVQLLRANEKRDMTPIYASKMAPDRSVASLAQVISDIADPQESMDFIKLMEVYGMDAVAVLNGQYSYLLEQVLADQSDAETPLEILESTDDELYPGQRVRLDFFDPLTTNEEEALVNSLAVFYLIEGHWAVTFQALSYTCRKLLSEYSISCNLTTTNTDSQPSLRCGRSPCSKPRLYSTVHFQIERRLGQSHQHHGCRPDCSHCRRIS